MSIKVKSLLAIGLLAGALSSVATDSYALEIFGIKLFGGKDEPQIEVVDPRTYNVTMTLRDASGDVQALESDLKAKSALFKDADIAVSGSLGVLSRARADTELMVAALYENARYSGLVTVLVNNRPVEDFELDYEFPAGQTVQAEIIIEAGPEFTFGNIDIMDADGNPIDSLDAGLQRGAPARSGLILTAEQKIVEAIRQEGYGFADTADRSIVADHDTQTLDVSLRFARGPLAPFGQTSVEGAKAVDSDFIAYMTGIEPGERYDPDTIDEAEARLRNLQVFESANVDIGDAPDAAGQIPVSVNVVERKHRYFGVGATAGNTDGLGFEGYWGHRNLFGRAEKLRIEGSVGGIGQTNELAGLNYRSALLFEKPGVIGPASSFNANLSFDHESPDGYSNTSVEASVGLSYRLSDVDRVSASAEVSYGQIEDAYDKSRYLTVALPLEYIRDTRDDTLNPTEGYRFSGLFRPVYEIYTGATFVKLDAEFSIYRALDPADKFVAAGRVAAGGIYGANLSGVPATERFFAGGGGSVRGYSYQGVGPRAADGTPTGGLSYVEASGEMRMQVTERIGAAAFVDAGAVAAGNGFNFDGIQVGAGVGLRYLTGFGPLRLDVAIPLNKRKGDPSFGVYAGIGQSF